MSSENMIIKAPWTDKQVNALNAIQEYKSLHSYTCTEHPEIKLVATTDGWKCPVCDYTQNWAHEASVRLGIVLCIPAQPVESEGGE
jgi:hypothetical protein